MVTISDTVFYEIYILYKNYSGPQYLSYEKLEYAILLIESPTSYFTTHSHKNTSYLP